MFQTPPGSPVPVVTTPVHRASRRIRGLPPERGPLPEMASATPQNAAEGTATAPYTLQKPRVPKVFHGSVFEDVEDWLAQFERVADFNGWTDADKMRNVYFSLEDGARTWYENREPFPSWSVFCRHLLASWANPDRRERAERAIQSRIQMPNESEQLFAGLVRCPPKTVAEFLTEATTMEKVLQQRSAVYDRQVSVASSVGQIGGAGSSINIESLCDLIRSVVRDELQKIHCPSQPTAGSLCSLIRNEVQQALQVPLPDNVPPVPTEPHRASYADAARRYIPASPRFVNPTPHDALPSLQPIQHLENRQPIPRKSDVWRTPDRRPLCYHCGEAGHVYRECPYRRLGLQGFAVDSPRPRFGERPRAIEEYLSQQRMPLPVRRQSRSPSPRRSSPNFRSFPGAAQARSPSPRREN
ncbi:uncharacterized protein LOC125758181 [Rhipicephalus sanguineus]|uniref:uncharacterized protein LOC125758181 n=1 Tax=Rhipicephalus sanguineus TaxID=34632 RepID=UPI0020C2C375|nr:uncharacterized protein LOC125758181 [Rhipicephalus sanguineus]